VHLEAFKIFIVEAEERIVGAQDLILKLEKDKSNKTIINEISGFFIL